MTFFKVELTLTLVFFTSIVIKATNDDDVKIYNDQMDLEIIKATNDDDVKIYNDQMDLEKCKNLIYEIGFEDPSYLYNYSYAMKFGDRDKFEENLKNLSIPICDEDKKISMEFYDKIIANRNSIESTLRNPKEFCDDMYHVDHWSILQNMKSQINEIYETPEKFCENIEPDVLLSPKDFCINFDEEQSSSDDEQSLSGKIKENGRYNEIIHSNFMPPYFYHEEQSLLDDEHSSSDEEQSLLDNEHSSSDCESKIKENGLYDDDEYSNFKTSYFNRFKTLKMNDYQDSYYKKHSKVFKAKTLNLCETLIKKDNYYIDDAYSNLITSYRRYKEKKNLQDETEDDVENLSDKTQDEVENLSDKTQDEVENLSDIQKEYYLYHKIILIKDKTTNINYSIENFCNNYSFGCNTLPSNNK